MRNIKALNKKIQEFRDRDPMLSVLLNQDRSAIAMLRGNLADPVDVAELSRAAYGFAREFIAKNQILFGWHDERMTLEDSRVMTDRQGKTHVIFAQKYGSAEVIGGNITIHYASDGSIYLVNSTLATEINVPDTPQSSSEQAIENATGHAGAGAILYKDIKPTLVVVDCRTLHRGHESPKYYLCWRMRIVPSRDSGIPDSIYLVSAINGEVLLRYSALKSVGTGIGYYSDGIDLISEAYDGTFRLRNAVTSAEWNVEPRPEILSFDDEGGGSLGMSGYSEDDNNNWNNDGKNIDFTISLNRRHDQRAEVDIHRFLGYVLSYYYKTHEQNSWDGVGANVHAHAHNYYLDLYELMPNQAFWDSGSQAFYFGDGDGHGYDYFTSLDTVGHEFSHAVTTGFKILQIYDGECGAVDEAVGDLFGILISLNHPADNSEPWHVFSQVMLPDHQGRNAADPSRDTDGNVVYDATNNQTKFDSAYYPDHYSIRYTGEDDDHGVHINCPIITHAVYLMTNGGTHRLSGITVTPIGVEPVEQMLYYVISAGLLSDTSDFASFRRAFITACKDLYPDNFSHLLSVKTAFQAVGIGPDLGMRFIVERSTLGEDEIQSRRVAPDSNGTALVPDAFRIVVDGFTAKEIGIGSLEDELDVTSPIGDDMLIRCTGNVADSGGYGADEQRFTFSYLLDFGATNNAFNFPDETKQVILNATIPSLNLSASAQLELIKQPNPFLRHGNPPWLSMDLRVFVVKENEKKFGVTMSESASGAPRFIQDVMKALTDGKGQAGGQSFDEGLSLDQEASALYLQPNDADGKKVFNFAYPFRGRDGSKRTSALLNP